MENNKRKQISEFYKQIFSDEKLKERFKEKAKKIASEEDLRKLIREEIMPLMEKYNVSFSENELIEFEKGTLNKMSDELFDEALEGVTGGLSRPTIAGGLLALTLVASGATALGQTSHAAKIGTDSDTSITQTVDTNEDAAQDDENINFSEQEVKKWTMGTLKNFLAKLNDGEINTSSKIAIKNIVSAQNYLNRAKFKVSSGIFFLDGEEISLEDVNFIRNFEINEDDTLAEGQNFENKLVTEWTAENIRNFVNYLKNLPEEYFVDNNKDYGLKKDKYNNLINNLNNLYEHITFYDNNENLAIDGKIAYDLSDLTEDLIAYFQDSLGYDIELAYFDSTEEAEDNADDAEDNDENDEVNVDIEDEEEAAEISNEAEEDADNDKEAEASSKTDDSTASDIKDVVDTVNSIFNCPLNFAFNTAIDNQKLGKIKDKFKFVYDHNNMLHVVVGEEVVPGLDDVAYKLKERTRSLNIPVEYEAHKWDVNKAIALNNQLNSVTEPTSEMKEDLHNFEMSMENGTFKGDLPMDVARSLVNYLNTVKKENLMKSFKSNSIGVFSSKSLNADTYKLFLKCINNPDYFKAGTSTLNDESEETKNLKTKLQMACNHVYITPKGEAYVNGHTGEADKKLSPNTLKELASFAQDNSGYEIKTRKCTTMNNTLSELLKAVKFNKISTMSQDQANQIYETFEKLNRSGALNNLSPEMKDEVYVFVLKGREAGLFPEKETSSNNEEASSTIATSNETTSNTNDDETSNTSSESYSILAQVASATVSVIDSTIRGAGKLIGKIFSLWK